MRVRCPSTGQPYPDAVVAGNLGTDLVAGFHTTSFTVMWARYDIARHPDMQKRIAQELAVAGLLQVQGQPPARELEWPDLTTASPYFNAVLKESMRLNPVAATGTVREAPRDMELGGFPIPQGSRLWIPIHSLHLSTHNFSEPTSFQPERWLNQDSQSGTGQMVGQPSLSPTEAVSKSKVHDPLQEPLPESPSTPTPNACPYTVPGSKPTPKGNAAAPSKSMLPFSDGPRNCVGLNFANANIRTVLLTILSRFWLELDPSISNHEEVVKAQELSLVLTCSRPIQLALKPHL
uniref:Cytochrome P450 n=1 Tax=Dunaliella tertiolecta TaxID=3047 RepID=A0A7S3R9P3_DUNTE|mmetsp:Transcript_26080/g.70650  ORF Transcript_26080/g.70650 Transcript_26080/m.70650 type:complete len:291 (-) Transcript_26080:967-1839(-)